MNTEEAGSLACELLRRHELEDWRFEFDRAKLRFGLCCHRRKTISLSRHLTLLNEERHVRDTLLHEIAHAKAGWRAAHGPQWRSVAAALGCRTRACYDHEAVMTPPRAWSGECPGCGRTLHRHRRPRRKIACADCCRKFAENRFDARFAFNWKRNRDMIAA